MQLSHHGKFTSMVDRRPTGWKVKGRFQWGAKGTGPLGGKHRECSIRRTDVSSNTTSGAERFWVLSQARFFLKWLFHAYTHNSIFILI